MTMLDYELHKLGWRAFQDLSAIILQEVLSQTFHTFADSNDGGRDGAFHGSWRSKADPDPCLTLNPGIATVTQCKFSAKPSGTLSLSALEEEFKKVERLHKRGLCDAYIILTNLRVTGNAEEKITEHVKSLGVKQVLTLDGKWICQQISKRNNLRRYVPRVYGLGDLGKILDDRRLDQANALIARMKGDLTTFVPTASYRRASTAVTEDRFVLLLGEAGCGKSTIAAMLAIVALDSWGCSVKRVDSASELISAWDPNDPEQIFWVDDAFGSIRHDRALTDGWSRRMDQVMTAISQGARVILTSRDYIYREARPLLKEYLYSQLREDRILIDITELTTSEKRQILYNHLRDGDQPRKTLHHWSPDLQRVAAVNRFLPELARRLAHRAFTSSSELQTPESLIDFFDRPVEFLTDVLHQLDDAKFATLACVYLSGDELAAPINFTPQMKDAIARLGSSISAVSKEFESLEGTFLIESLDTVGNRVWRFHHPTIREGLAAIVAKDPNAISIFIEGLRSDELVRQIDCNRTRSRGSLVDIPPNQYARVIQLLPKISQQTDFYLHDPVIRFLQYRCSTEFLIQWAEARPKEIEMLLNFTSYMEAFTQPKLLAKLHSAGALPESIRKDSIRKISKLALDFDGGWLSPNIIPLFTEDERITLLDKIRTQIIPELVDLIDLAGDGWDENLEPSDPFDTAAKNIRAYKMAYQNDALVVEKLEEAENYIENAIRSAELDFTPSFDTALAKPSPPREVSTGGRNEFDDVFYG